MHAAWDPLPAVHASSSMPSTQLGLFSVFSTPWFLLLMTVLVISIICCTLDRTPATVALGQPRARGAAGRPSSMPAGSTAPSWTGEGSIGRGRCTTAFRRRHFRRQRTVPRSDGATYVYGDRNQYQKLATLLTHAGLVLFLAGGALTVAAGFETVVFVGEGETAPVQSVGTPGNLLVKNNAFFAPRREDGSFADFSTDLSVYRDGAEIARETVRVNDPLRLEGFVFHQNTFGPTAELTITDDAGALVWDGPLLLDDELLGAAAGLHDRPGAEAVGLVAVLSEDATGAPLLALQGVGPADPRPAQNDDALPGHHPAWA